MGLRFRALGIMFVALSGCAQGVTSVPLQVADTDEGGGSEEELPPMRAPSPYTGPEPHVNAVPSPAVQRRTVRVHIDSDTPVTLRRATGFAPHDAAMPHGEVVCHDPCDEDVTFLWPGHYFVVQGEDLTNDADVSFHWTSSKPTVEVRKGDRAAWITGLVFHSLGALGLVGSGVVALGAAIYDESRAPEHGPQPNSFDGGLGLGLGITALAGLGLLVVGIPIWVTSESRVSVVDGNQRFEVTADGVKILF